MFEFSSYYDLLVQALHIHDSTIVKNLVRLSVLSLLRTEECVMMSRMLSEKHP